MKLAQGQQAGLHIQQASGQIGTSDLVTSRPSVLPASMGPPPPRPPAQFGMGTMGPPPPRSARSQGISAVKLTSMCAALHAEDVGQDTYSSIARLMCVQEQVMQSMLLMFVRQYTHGTKRSKA